MKKAAAALLAAALALTALCGLGEPIVYTDMPTVQAVQQALNDAGYDCGEPDGYVGAWTLRALRAYQADHDMEQTEEITEVLLAALGVEPVSPAEPEAGTNGSAAPLSGVWEEQEYTFEGIPWGSGVAETESAMRESRLVRAAGRSMSICPTVWMGEPIELALMAYQWSSVDLARAGATYFFDEVQRQVAGYVPATVYASFLYGENDGKVVEEGRLNGVVVEYNAGDYGLSREQLFDNLARVMDGIYGHEERQPLPQDQGWYTVWIGPGDTAVALVILYDERLGYTGQEDSVELFFGETDAYSRARKLKELL